MSDWKKFLDATKDRKPNTYVMDAVRILNLKKGKALDLGCGAGIDAKYLAQNGFDVTAVDNHGDSVTVAREVTSGLPVRIIEAKMEDFSFDDEGYDFIVAWRSIPFLRKDIGKEMLKKIQAALRHGGIFVFALFGPEDGWASEKKDMSFFTLDEVKQILSSMKFVRVFEEKAEGNIAGGGRKFFHKIDCITQKE